MVHRESEFRESPLATADPGERTPMEWIRGGEILRRNLAASHGQGRPWILPPCRNPSRCSHPRFPC